MTLDSSNGSILVFDRYQLYSSKRLLTRDDVRIPLSARPLSILIALAQRAGEIVGKQELLEIVWPDVSVDEGSLRFHMVSLRKALGEGRHGARFIATVPGRGYSFVAKITKDNKSSHSQPTEPDLRFLRAIPSLARKMFGRETDVAEVAELLALRRIVTIVGPGGIGKTTVAAGVARAIAPLFEGEIQFVDLSGLTDPLLVTSALATTLCLAVQSDVEPALMSYLRERRMLLIFDNLTCSPEMYPF